MKRKPNADTIPVGRDAEKALAEFELADLVHAARTQTQQVARLAAHIINDVLLTELIKLDGDGMATREFGTAMGSVAVANHSDANSVIVGGTGAVSYDPPDSGPGIALVRASKAQTLNLTGHVLTLWGTAGQLVTVQVFTKPQPPAFGPA